MNAIGQVAPEAEVEETKKLTPGQIRKSITDNGLISFVDGKSYKTLKRHLTGNGMSFSEYKERYGSLRITPQRPRPIPPPALKWPRKSV